MGKNKNNKKKRKRSMSHEEDSTAANTVKPNGNRTSSGNETQNKKPPASAATLPSKTKKQEQPKKKQLPNNNPLFVKQQAFLSSLPESERNELFSPKISSDRRGELWMQQADLGGSLVNDYAWATPNETAIRICKEFSPLVEIGCGANAYWCKVLKAHGIDIVGHDINEQTGGKIGNNGNPNKKKNKKKQQQKSSSKKSLQDVIQEHANRTLLLCYPDDEDQQVDGDADNYGQPPASMAFQCLEHYQGDYIVHVGELFLDANYSLDQSPWGRSSSEEFQVRLASEFHCLLKVELPNWLHVRDTISVWKRSEQCSIVFGADDDEEDEDDDDDEIDEVVYKHIPVEERLPINIAAPCLAHLLPKDNANSEGTSNKAIAKPLATTKKNAPIPTADKNEKEKDESDSNDDDDDSDDDSGDDQAGKKDGKDDSSSSSSSSSSEEDAQPAPPKAKESSKDDSNKPKKKRRRLDIAVSHAIQKKITQAFKLDASKKVKYSTAW